MENAIFQIKDYGKINIDIKSVMDKRRITRNKVKDLTGCTYNVINRYYKNEITRVDLDVLARICYVLDCDVKDVLRYKK